MSPFTLLSGLALPVLIVIGALAAWRMTRNDDPARGDDPGWRDDSLDEWRGRRDAETEAQRTARTDKALSDRLAFEEQLERRNKRPGD